MQPWGKPQASQFIAKPSSWISACLHACKISNIRTIIIYTKKFIDCHSQKVPYQKTIHEFKIFLLQNISLQYDPIAGKLSLRFSHYRHCLLFNCFAIFNCYLIFYCYLIFHWYLIFHCYLFFHYYLIFHCCFISTIPKRNARIDTWLMPGN